MIELPPALAIEADLLDLGMSKHDAASLTNEYEAGNLPGLGLFVGRVAHFGRGERFVRDAIREAGIGTENRARPKSLGARR